ncbi:MAG: sensor domain-containing diguanylate cyclase [Methylovulum sp.]|nr:sensor domain-containing diguanylate cyclase [Methylovulum sp.]
MPDTILEDVFNAINLGLIIVDAQYNVLFWNDWIFKHTHIKQVEAKGHKLGGVFSEPLPPTFLNALKNTLEYGLPTIISNALHRSPLPLYDFSSQTNEKVRINQSITMSPLLPQRGGRHCIIQVTDSTTSIKREKMLLSHSEILRRDAVTDSLTGIFNRRFFDEHYKIAFHNAIRQRQCLSILMVDIDYFKNYNDYYGHLSGDNTLRAVAQALKSQLFRASDVIARYGGEEFVLILPDLSAGQAEKVAEKLKNSVFNLAIPHKNSPLFNQVTISIGLSVGMPKVEYDILGRADAALYLAKQQGRNRCVALPLLDEEQK